jgi:hypothetical protein
MMTIDFEFAKKYQASIPKCCDYQTYEEHAEYLMLCWGLAHQVRTNGNPTSCGICECNNTPEGIAAREAWNEENRKKRMWNVISTP